MINATNIYVNAQLLYESSSLFPYDNLHVGLTWISFLTNKRTQTIHLRVKNGTFPLECWSEKTFGIDIRSVPVQDTEENPQYYILRVHWKRNWQFFG